MITKKSSTIHEATIMCRNASLAAAVLLSLATVGCDGSPRFDISNEESAKASIEKLSAGMSPTQRQTFAKDMATVLSQDGVKKAVQETEKNRTAAPADKTAIYKPLHGLTAAELHDKAEAIRQAQAKPK
jgi:hypothetical protein